MVSNNHVSKASLLSANCIAFWHAMKLCPTDDWILKKGWLNAQSAQRILKKKAISIRVKAVPYLRITESWCSPLPGIALFRVILFYNRLEDPHLGLYMPDCFATVVSDNCSSLIYIYVSGLSRAFPTYSEAAAQTLYLMHSPIRPVSFTIPVDWPFQSLVGMQAHSGAAGFIGFLDKSFLEFSLHWWFVVRRN